MFEHARHRLASKVDELETRRTLELAESIAACLYALQSFHHQVRTDSSAQESCAPEVSM